MLLEDGDLVELVGVEDVETSTNEMHGSPLGDWRGIWINDLRCLDGDLEASRDLVAL